MNLSEEAFRKYLGPVGVPVGGTIVGDDAEHAIGSLTGPAILVVASTGGTAKIGGVGVTSATGIPVIAGASYDAGGRFYAAIEDVRVYVPAGATVLWGAHQ